MIIDWLEKGPLDFEYKQYKLMAYLKNVDKDWNDYKLYPHLSNIVEYNTILTQIKRTKTSIKSLFPNEIKGIDTNKMEIIYEPIPQPNTDITDELEEIIDWGIDRMDEYSQVGMIIYQDISEDIKISNIGLESLVKDEGYVILFDDIIQVYYYNVGNIITDEHGGRFVLTKKIKECVREKFQTPEDIKLTLVNEFNDFFVPNFYCVEGHKPYPIVETVLPIVKRKILVENRLS
jgi:hypothetical protein